MGTGQYIDLLFSSLAKASGFEARVVNLADRAISSCPFVSDDYSANLRIAVKFVIVGVLYPASTYVITVLLGRKRARSVAFRSQTANWISTPMSPPICRGKTNRPTYPRGR